VGVALLAVAVVSFLSFSSQEQYSLGVTLERFLARTALAELRVAYGRRSRAYYTSLDLPATLEEATPEHSAGLATHSLVTAPDPDLAGPDATRQRLAEALRKVGARHVLLYQPGAAADGEVDVLRFVVRYRDARGIEREVARRELVH
jgi:hypothetical protein